MRDPRWILVSLGSGSSETDDAWMKQPSIRGFIRIRRPAPSGRRLKSRALGLGFDAFMVACKARLLAPRAPLLAANPWVAVALRCLGHKSLAATGVYAGPGMRSFHALRTGLGDTTVVTTSQVEADAWVAAGGRAIAVRYGNTFGYNPSPVAKASRSLVIFFGGTSDRDFSELARLRDELVDRNVESCLIVAGGQSRTTEQRGSVTIERYPFLVNAAFGALLAGADVVLLPLIDHRRSAGHMVLVGALEANVPVIISDIPGTREYIDGRFVRPLTQDKSVLSQIEDALSAQGKSEQSARDYWSSEYSALAYAGRVTSALAALSAREY